MSELWAGYGNALIGLIGVFVGGFLTIAKDTFSSFRVRKEDGSYAAIRLICILEEYADNCIGVVGDDGTAYGQPAGRTSDGQEYYSAQVSAPTPLNYPDDIVWRSLKAPLMHRILALPNLARSTDRHITAASEHASPPDYYEAFEARQEGYAKIGIEALEIAHQLRNDFEVAVIGRVHSNADWNPENYLREKLAEFDALHKKRAQQVSELEVFEKGAA